MKKITFIAIAMLLVLTTSNLFAQIKFNGYWIQTAQESISGKLYGNGLPKNVTINIDHDNVELTSVTSYSDGDEIIKEELSESKPFESKSGSGRKKVTTVKWSTEKTGFTTVTDLYSLSEASKLDFKIIDAWTIQDGKLILDRKNENYTNGETWESKATYEKQ